MGYREYQQAIYVHTTISTTTTLFFSWECASSFIKLLECFELYLAKYCSKFENISIVNNFWMNNYFQKLQEYL